MARIEVEITGNAKGLEQAAGKAGAATKGLAASTKMSADEIAKWDAAARRNQMEQYGQGIRRTTSATQQNVVATKQATTATDQSTTSLIRHVYAQRSALSASNNLAHAFTGIAAGGRGMAASVGIATRQVATLGVVGMGAAGGLRAMWTALMGPAGLVIALSAVATALTGYISNQTSARGATDDATQANREYIESLKGVASENAAMNRAINDTPYKDAVAAVEQLRVMVDWAKEGIITKTEVIERYNDTLGDATGEVKSLVEVEDFLINKSDAYVRAMAFRAAAMLALEDAAEKLFKAQKTLATPLEGPQEVPDAFAGMPGFEQFQRQQQGFAQGVSDMRDILVDSLEDSAKESVSVARSLMEQFNEIAREFGLTFSSTAKENVDKSAQSLSSLNDQLDKLRQESIQASLSGYEKELQASSHKYNELRKQAEQYYRDGKIQAQDYTNYLIRLSGFEIAERGRIVGPAQRAPLSGSGPSTGPSSLPAVNIAQTVTVDLTTDPVWDAFVDDLDKQLGRAVQSFGRDFLRTLSTINQQANVTFGGVVSSLVSSLTGGITEIMSTVFSKQLGDAIKGAFGSGGLGKSGTYWAAGGAMVGGIISGSTKRTSTGGQALGGALSGAGTGAALGSVVMPGIGTAVGAVVGAVVGAIGGIFAASSARKQEKAQEDMLAEQRKQTALLERQNALAYASSIIGQMTAGGIVTGIMRDAFGQLVATVRGDQLEFVLQRARASR